MGMLDFLKRLNGNPATYQGQEVTYGPSLIHDEVLGMSPAEVWRTQPHLRTVVTFMARNIAQLGVHSFLRTDETDRQRLRDGALVGTLKRPNASTTTYELIFGLVADLALFDVAYLHWVADGDAPSGYSLYRLPPNWVTPQGGDAFAYSSYLVQVNGGVSKVRLSADSVVDFHGWNPDDTRRGSSPVGALKAILAEQMMAVQHRQQVWQRGGRISSVITRPADAKWSDAARESFRKDWNSKFAGAGEQAGGTPILEDGMTISKLDFNAHEQQFVEAAKLALATVAGVYHVNPTFVGVLDNANYSNVREFRKMLYGDTLGPVISMIEDRVNTFLVPMLDKRDGVYVEFNIAEKLQGNFEDQAAALASSVGAPYMLRSEARARMNLPSIDGADDLVVPLNVLVGGQASSRDSGSQNEAPKDYAGQRKVLEDSLLGIPPYRKAAPSDPQRDKLAEVLAAFFKRQGKTVLSEMGAGGDWWDKERWDSELTDDLKATMVTLAGIVGKAEAARLGFDKDLYDEARTVDFLTSVAKRYAGNINATTKAKLDADATSDDPAPADVFNQAKDSRASGIAVGVGTFVAGFGSVEAARQITESEGGEPTKTWVTGPNPRSSHAAMNGETVGIDDLFSNGMDWPGSGGDVDEVAGCNCSTVIDF